MTGNTGIYYHTMCKMSLFCFAILGFELMALILLGKWFTSKATPPAKVHFFFWVYFSGIDV
jgi:hypothetical protein